MERRQFLKNSALASSAFMVPSFVKALEGATFRTKGFKRLVIVQLSGGNDGLNTIIPYTNDFYYKARPSLGIAKNIIKINGTLGFHESLEPLQRLYDDGYLSIVNNVGYPNPNRSHFRSMDIWQTASDSNSYLKTGWIGRYLDMHAKKAYNAIEVNETLSLAMKGKHHRGIATKDHRVLYRTGKDPFLSDIAEHYNDAHLSEHNLGYLYKTLIQAKSSAQYIYEKTKIKLGTADYPQHSFGKQLKTTAQFINSGLDTSVYYASLGGFDTHANQQGTQKRLLGIYAEAIEAFVEDLKSQDTFRDTLILTFSEFGRRVAQNAANGTDHGTANNVFILGEDLKTPGFYNELTKLNDLDDNGDIKFEIDFRTIYATVLNKWLEVDDREILNKEFNYLNFI
ncbi:DUF1501 domain-containing protein [Ichthyenterobacterium sp. W332]|uniref:DUF1501 domain-containing protein n=1 Tax=Microcosmobacter mediterraneus TaxID=3075607 RepID=A0ABU2YK49_9FLAO|nr:DUF1501 domain-containing protein [Ichthyenterobacterium sp. W332]MDT0558195.1 DUF1501 domain-containing protein [Ichthyenterobacterium sp. W332]